MVDAKKYLIPDIKLDGFIIEILDDKQKPALGLGFSVCVDGIGMSIMTDKDGIIKVSKPMNEIKISLVGDIIEESNKPVDKIESSTHKLISIKDSLGYTVKIRDDAAQKFDAWRDEVQKNGGKLDYKGGSMRSLGTPVTPGRIKTSLHHTGRAIDLNTEAGMRNPAKDLYVVVKDEWGKGSSGFWIVYCRCEKQDGTKGEKKKLKGWKWAKGAGEEVEVEGYFVNITEIANKNSLHRIGTHSNWKTNYFGCEWWHFQYEEGLTKDSNWGKEMNALGYDDENLLRKEGFADDPGQVPNIFTKDDLKRIPWSLKSPGTPSAAVSPPSSPAPAETTLSGKGWVSKFPGSKSLNDLDSNFKNAVEKFIGVLKSAGANVTINATKRPKERAYMMHYSWLIVNKKDQNASKIPPHEGVNINWWHGNQEKSKAVALEMVEGLGLTKLKTAPALQSNHIAGKAIDMDISWNGDLKIMKKDGSEVTITSLPKDGTNRELIEVAKTYDVIHFKCFPEKLKQLGVKDPWDKKCVEIDRPHWSINGG